MPEQSDLPQFFVGIGASAGGLAALRQLLMNLPLGRGFTYVVIQHMDPSHPSMLDEILAKESALTVKTAETNEVLSSDHLYIAPSDKDVTIVDGALHLMDVHDTGARHSVDQLFKSLADGYGAAAIGIVLSGTGTDGCLGAQALKAADGVVLVQDPHEAEHKGMPSAIIEARLSNIIAPANRLGIELGQVVSSAGEVRLNHHIGRESDTRDALIHALRRKSGYPIDQYKEGTVNRRIERRMVANKLDTVEAYLELVEQSDTEADLLIQDMQVSVTAFFRDKDAFDAIAEAIGEIASRKHSDDFLRIWVPGCATGEEAFSIAILVSEAFGERLATVKVQIFATDIDADAIAHARKGEYQKSVIEDLAKPFVEKYLVATNGIYRIQPQIRDMVVFAEHDLIQDPPFGRLDLISCRNVLIYFKRSAQERLLKNFHYVLNPGAYLALGPSEGIGGSVDFFEQVNQSAKVFIRRDGQLPPPVFSTALRNSRPRLQPAATASIASVAEQIREALFEQYAPASIMVDSRFDIIHLHGDLEPFMQLPQGEITVNALLLAVAPLRLELRLLLQKSQRDGSVVRARPIKVSAPDGNLMVTLVAIPVNREPDTGTFSLVLFESHKPVERVAGYAGTDNAVDFRILELEQELVASRDHLQTNIEELGTSNEELQSINEEFQSTTEELQSTNEEFQTTNEELQSTNEELHTVNEELKRKTTELESANDNLQGILNAVVEGIVVIDSDMQVTHYSADSQLLLDLLPVNIGRPLMSVSGSIDPARLATDIRSAIQSGKVVEREIDFDDRVYRTRFIPQQTGLIMSFIDETERIQASRDAQRLATVVMDSNDAILVQNRDGRIMAWNQGAERMYGYTEAEALAMTTHDLSSTEQLTDAQGVVRALLMDKKELEPFEARRLTKDGHELEVWIIATALRDDDGTPYAVATTERDLTARRLADSVRNLALDEHDVLELFNRLTKREREIMTLMVAGSANASSQQIAAQLGISPRTVEVHRRRVNKKMNARSMSDLVDKSRVCGIFEPRLDA